MKLGDKDIKLYLGDAEVEKIYLGTEQVYGGSEPPHDYSQDYLTFVAEDDDMSVGLTYAGNNVFQYSTDSGETWSNLEDNESTSSVNSGETIIFKASGLTISQTDGIGTLVPSANASVQGNVMSLVYGDDFSGQTTINNHQFLGLFYEGTYITSAENIILPATTLANYCYQSMFNGCTALTTAPALPAITLAPYCYRNMFRGCTSLISVSELPATTLAEGCYQFIFSGCTSLNYIKCLATNISASYALQFWVSNVSPTGTFVKAASMSSWTTGNNGIPNNWTVQNDDGSAVFGGEGSGNAD